MSCNRCASASQRAATAVGAPAVEPAWAAGRGANGHCPVCGGWLRVDGGCDTCAAAVTVAVYDSLLSEVGLSDGIPVAPTGDLWFAPLSCGHTATTDVEPGGEEWCTKCDGFRRVEWSVQGQNAFYRRQVDEVLESLGQPPVTGEEMARARSGLAPGSDPDKDVLACVVRVQALRMSQGRPPEGAGALSDAGRPGPGGEREQGTLDEVFRALLAGGLGKDSVRYITGPLVVYDGSWGRDVPGWLRSAVRRARIEQVQQEVERGEQGELGTLEEACAYLMTASLAVPLNHDWATIYIYVAGRVLSRHGTLPAGLWPALGREEGAGLTPCLQDRLDGLRRWQRRATVRAAKRQGSSGNGGAVK